MYWPSNASTALYFRPLDAHGRIVLEPSDIDCVTDQNAKLLESIERRAGPVRVRLQNACDDALARQAGDGAVAVHSAQRFKTRDVARLRRVAKTDEFPALLVGGNQRRQRAWGGADEAIPRKCPRHRAGPVGEIRGLVLIAERLEVRIP